MSNGPRAPMTVPSGTCVPSRTSVGSPAVMTTVLFLNRPRGAPCRISASASPPQKLECTMSAPLDSSAEISAPYSPASSLGICEVAMSTPGFNTFIAASKQVLVAGILENARRATVEEHRQALQLVGERRDGQAIAARDIADHHVGVVALDEVAIFVDLLGRAAGFVDEYDFDRRAAETGGRVRRRQLAGVERLGDDLGTVTRWHAERSRRGTG